MSDNYKQWYDDAMCASNAAGYSGMTAAQTIEFMDTEWKAQHARITELKAQLADSKKDAELLDWLNGKKVWLHSGDGYYESSITFKWGDSIKRRNLRQAVDAAIQAEGKQA